MEDYMDDIEWLKSTFRPIPKPALPDDCIEYSLYLLNPALEGKNDAELKNKLHDVQRYANELQKRWLREYIWQRDGFQLELIKTTGEVCMLSVQDVKNNLTNSIELNFLQGHTEYGDSIEDEWVVVWLLRELTKKFPHLWVKVTDNDGEFLLIEASATLPEWLEPEVAENRVWINNGQLKIIRPIGNTKRLKKTDEKLSLSNAQQIIRHEPKRIFNSVSIEEEAFFRLKDYPSKIKENMHHSMVTIPRKLVYLLFNKASYVAPAIEAFYLRDPISLKRIQSKDAVGKVSLPPKDLVDISLKFPRVGYAQLKTQEVAMPDMWRSVLKVAEGIQQASLEIGIKLTIGFEILLSDKIYQDRAAVREMHLLLDDLVNGDAALPTDEELSKLERRQDDEKWLDINFEDFQRELNTRDHVGKKADFGDKGAQENLQRIVKQFESFLNQDELGDDGDMIGEHDSDTEEVDSDEDEEEDGEDKDASFDDDEFTKMMQEYMGMPPEVMREVMTGKIDALKNESSPKPSIGVSSKSKEIVEELSSSDEEEMDDAQLSELMKRMDSELRDRGVLDSQTPSFLNQPQAVEASSRKDKQVREAKEDHSEAEDEADFDQAFAKNLLAAFQSQGGMPGPASNFMAMMAEADDTKNMKGKRKKKV